MSLPNEVKEKLIRLIHAIVPYCKIYLFGSYAKGTQTKSSDIDLALQSEKKLERYTMAEIKDIIAASNILQKVDIVDLNNVSDDFKSNIMEGSISWRD